MEIDQRAFLVLGLPRTRTAWMSVFLSIGPSLCSHDLTNRCNTAEHMAGRMADRDVICTGNSDSGNIFILEEFMDLLPETRLIWVQRDPKAVIASMAKATGMPEEKFQYPIERIVDLQNQMLHRYDSISVNFDQLDDTEAMRMVWKYVTDGLAFPWEHYQRLQTMHIQIHDSILRQAITGADLQSESQILRNAAAFLA